MKTITFTCETITPMFLSGADGSTPELRPPSIKGALRFWWRAMNGHLSLEELKRKESEIFGGTDGDSGGRSKVIIFHPKITREQDVKISTTPHHREEYCNQNNQNCNYRGGRCMKAIPRDAKFYEFELKLRFDENTIKESEFDKLVKATFLLGGFGKRARRGFGSVKISNIYNGKNDYVTFINSISRLTTSQVDYPYIQNIEIGNRKYNDYQDLLIKIGESSHTFKHNSLGFASGQDRLSSPIYVSVIKVTEKEYYPIITTLKTPNKITTITNQTSFKTAIL